MYLRLVAVAGAYALGAFTALQVARLMTARHPEKDSGFLFV